MFAIPCAPPACARRAPRLPSVPSWPSLPHVYGGVCPLPRRASFRPYACVFSCFVFCFASVINEMALWNAWSRGSRDIGNAEVPATPLHERASAPSRTRTHAGGLLRRDVDCPRTSSAAGTIDMLRCDRRGAPAHRASRRRRRAPRATIPDVPEVSLTSAPDKPRTTSLRPSDA